MAYHMPLLNSHTLELHSYLAQNHWDMYLRKASSKSSQSTKESFISDRKPWCDLPNTTNAQWDNAFNAFWAVNVLSLLCPFQESLTTGQAFISANATPKKILILNIQRNEHLSIPRDLFATVNRLAVNYDLCKLDFSVSMGSLWNEKKTNTSLTWG